MKKFFAFNLFAAAMIAAAVSFVGCDPPGGGGITPYGETVTVVGDMTQISGTIANIEDLDGIDGLSLRLIDWEDVEGSREMAPVVLSSTAIAADGSFTLSLPATMKTKNMYPVSEELDAPGVTISNPDVLLGGGDLYIYSGETRVGHVNYEGYHYTASSETDVDAGLVFVSGNVTATGSGGESGERYVYDISLKGGWNWNYLVEEYTDDEDIMTVTTTLPAGVEMFFYFSPIL